MNLAQKMRKKAEQYALSNITDVYKEVVKMIEEASDNGQTSIKYEKELNFWDYWMLTEHNGFNIDGRTLEYCNNTKEYKYTISW